MPPAKNPGTIEIRALKGMLRRPSQLVLPPDVARIAENVRNKDGLMRRRSGSVILGTRSGVSTDCLTFDGSTTQYVTYPDHASYDLKTKWAILVQFSLGASFSNTGALVARAASAAPDRRTFALYIDAARMVYFSMHDEDGNAFTLQGTTALTLGTAYTLLVYRDGATLACHLNGNSTAENSIDTLTATKKNFPGAMKVGVGLWSNDDFVADFQNKFNGKIGSVVIFEDFREVDDLLFWPGTMKYPNPRDRRIALAAYNTYSKEAGTQSLDLSIHQNHGTLVGSPARSTLAITSPYVAQHLSTFEVPSTGDVQNLAWIGGDFYVQTVRRG